MNKQQMKIVGVGSLLALSTLGLGVTVHPPLIAGPVVETSSGRFYQDFTADVTISKNASFTCLSVLALTGAAVYLSRMQKTG